VKNVSNKSIHNSVKIKSDYRTNRSKWQRIEWGKIELRSQEEEGTDIWIVTFEIC
jgi:hypothetical protein